MKTHPPHDAETARASWRARAVHLAVLTCAGVCATDTRALEIDAGLDDVKLRWDNTFKYSNAFRMKRPSQEVLAPYNPNLDDGDRNFDRGLVSNRWDLFSEVDMVWRGSVGMRVSAAGWYDTVYQQSNDNPGPAGAAVPNAVSVPFNQFTGATQRLHGARAEVLDAFVFGSATLGDTLFSARFGRHALLWGESLFFGTNGIAGGQASVDIAKLLSVPGSQFKEVIRPTHQLSGSAQLTPDLSMGAYVQFDWERNRIPAAGSYFSRSDIFDEGGERLLLPPALGGPVGRSADLRPKRTGQGGLQVRWRHAASDTDFGLYATRYHDKDFRVYLRPGSGYALAFHEGVVAWGASFSRSIQSVNLAGEVSTRRNAPLVRAMIADPAGSGDNGNHPLYPVGKSVHAQLSLSHTLDRTSLWDGGLLLAEVAWHRRTSITKNAAALDPNTTRDALAIRVLFSPTFYQALPGVDLSVPVGLGHNPYGRSSVVTLFNGGSAHGGDLSIGLSFDYRQSWKGGLGYTRYLGRAGGVLDPSGFYSFRQSLKDRDFISFSLQRTL